MTSFLEKKRELANDFAIISDTPTLDADCIIEHVTQKTKAQLIVNANDKLTAADEKLIDTLATARIKGKPIAYLLGYKSFWTLDLIVTQDTLIPRPDTECLVQWLLDHFDNSHFKAADLGTGSGAIALALAIERHNWMIHATDKSDAALAIAKQNAVKNNLNNACFYLGDWCDALPEKDYDIIVSNPPYIEENDPHLLALTYEPKSALTAGLDGLCDIKQIAEQAKNHLKSGGVLIVEHGYNKAEMVCEIFQKEGYRAIISHNDLSGVPRFVTARR